MTGLLFLPYCFTKLLYQLNFPNHNNNKICKKKETLEKHGQKVHFHFFDDFHSPKIESVSSFDGKVLETSELLWKKGSPKHYMLYLCKQNYFSLSSKC